MAGKYRLRLRDGTILVVDHGGLRTWLLDDKAMVQPAGSAGWRPLRQFLENEPAPSPPVRRPESPSPPVVPRLAVPATAVEPGAGGSWPGEGGVVPLAEAISSRPARPGSTILPGPIDLGEIARGALTVPVAEEVSPRRAAPVAEIPIIPLKPLDEDDDDDDDDDDDEDQDAPRRTRAERINDADEGLEELELVEREGLLEKAASRAKALLAVVSGWLGRLTRGERPRPSPQPAAAPVRREALRPPPAISELPVLRLAPLDDEPRAGDVYRGDRLAGLWPRVRRGLLIVAVGAAGILVAVTLPEWLPRQRPSGAPPAAPDAGHAAAIPPSTPPQRQPASAKDARLAAARLPHLAPETVRFVMNRAGASDPLDVFRRADDAARRGQSKLRGSEAQELWSLEEAALSFLRPAEQKRVRAYGLVGTAGSRAEDAGVLALVARATRRLSTRSRERLRALLGKAIAAGLAADASPAAPP